MVDICFQCIGLALLGTEAVQMGGFLMFPRLV